MRYSDTPLRPVVPSIGYAEITPKAPISTVFKVVAGVNGMFGEYSRRTSRFPRESAGEDHGPPPEYQGEERRKLCRRIRQLPCLLDTRTGIDRRKTDGGDDMPATHINREV